MDLFLSSDVVDLSEDDRVEEGDDGDGEHAVDDFDTFLLGRDDINFICSQGKVFSKYLSSKDLSRNRKL